MKLYYTPGACSLAPHIALHEIGAKFETEKVDLAKHTTASGADYVKTVTSKGYVPALQLDDGSVLTEVGAILNYLADQKPAAGLAPAAGTMPRYRLLEWLNYISSEVHKSFSPMFAPGATDDMKSLALANVGRRFDWLSGQLKDRKFLLGDQFSVADIYLFTVLGWTKFVNIDLGKWPVLAKYSASIGSRPAVQGALRAEGLMK